MLDARRRMRDAVDRSAWDEAQAHERTMFEAALAVRDEDGEIADPEAMCAALGVPRYVYTDVVRRYGAPVADDEPLDPASGQGSVSCRVLLPSASMRWRFPSGNTDNHSSRE